MEPSLEMSKGTRIGTGLLASTLAYWVVFVAVGSILFARLDNEEIMHIGSPERRFFFTWFGWVLLGSYLSMILGYRWGVKLARLPGTDRRPWLTPFLALLG